CPSPPAGSPSCGTACARGGEIGSGHGVVGARRPAPAHPARDPMTRPASSAFPRVVLLLLLVAGAAAACRVGAPGAPGSSATAEEARRFLQEVNDTAARLAVEQQRAGWVASTYITTDTQAIAARANQAFIDAMARYAREATRFDDVELPPDARRQLELLKVMLVVATPSDAGEAEELANLMASMEATYGRGTWCADPAKRETCLDIEQITEVMASSRDPQRLRQVWEGWHTIAIPMKKDYARFVELANKGARELGFADAGAMWRAKYDMPPDAFTKELDRLWEQVRPLYVSLHAYVRMKLRQR